MFMREDDGIRSDADVMANVDATDAVDEHVAIGGEAGTDRQSIAVRERAALTDPAEAVETFGRGLEEQIAKQQAADAGPAADDPPDVFLGEANGQLLQGVLPENVPGIPEHPGAFRGAH